MIIIIIIITFNRHENSKRLHSVTKESDKYSRELELELEVDNLLSPTEIARKSKKKAKHEGLKQLESRWQEKPLHGQFAARANNADVDTHATHQWLRTESRNRGLHSSCTRSKFVH